MSVVKVPVTDSERPDLVALIDEEDALKVFAYDWQTEWDYKARKTHVVSKTNLGGGEYRTIKLHHLIRRPGGGSYPVHRDGNPFNNTRRNLVLIKAADAKRPKKTSKYTGVTLHRGSGQWQAQIMVDYKNTFLGRFAAEEEAAKAYDAAARRLHGESARTNFSQEEQP